MINEAMPKAIKTSTNMFSELIMILGFRIHYLFLLFQRY